MIYTTSLMVHAEGNSNSLTGAVPAETACGEIEAAGPRTAAARAYVTAVGRRRATWLRQCGAPPRWCRTETDVGAVAGALAELAQWRPRLAPVETWCFWLPAVTDAPDHGRGAVLILVSCVAGPAVGLAQPGRLAPSAN